MNIAAYCRVSTDKADQFNSLEAQKEFFSEYTKRTGDTLVRLYADEGISGTKIKNRKEFLRMMSDAEHGLFDMVVVKDISRFARNTVDLLQNVRKLKSLGIETQFLTANMTSMGNSEFVLTIFGALAQEESANTSKRVKFGKKMNAEKGRVPNIVYGYDKTIGDYFNLAINKEESKVVQQIYKWYTEEGYGAAKIANMLNEKGYKTKRNCKWSQNATCRILTNEIYKGWSGMKASEYKKLKGLRKESLRDNMTDIEVALTNIGEIATRDIAREEHPQGLKENLNVAKRGGGVAKGAKDLYEKETKKSAISKSNSLNYKYIEEQKQIEEKKVNNMAENIINEDRIKLNKYNEHITSLEDLLKSVTIKGNYEQFRLAPCFLLFSFIDLLRGVAILDNNHMVVAGNIIVRSMFELLIDFLYCETDRKNLYLRFGEYQDINRVLLYNSVI